MKTFSPSRSARKGFNLIELLVVIGIIAVLASLLLPVLSAAKAKAYLTQCTNNERQLAQAWVMFSADNADKLVPNGYITNMVSDVKLWVPGASHRADPGGAVLDTFTNASVLVNPEYAAFAQYIKTPATYKCPADKGKLMVSGAAGEDGSSSCPDTVRSYSLNGYMNWNYPQLLSGDNKTINQGFKVFQRGSDFDAGGVSPSDLLLFLDVAPKFICHSAFVIRYGTGHYHYPSIEHGGMKGVVSFSDGHVETHKWVSPDTKTIGQNGSYVQNNHYYGFSVDEDLDWLQKHASVKK